MRPSILLLAAALAAAIVTAGAGANGSPYSPGLVYGWGGVEARKSGVHYVAFGMPKSTVVAAVRARDGHVLRSASSRASSASRSSPTTGRRAASPATAAGSSSPRTGRRPGAAGKTSFVVLGTKTLKPRLHRTSAARGRSTRSRRTARRLPRPAHHRRAQPALPRPHPRRRARRKARRRARRPPREGAGDGRRAGRARVERHGRWAYTLYARRKDVPFVHALDTARRQAYCIGLPVRVDYNRQWGLKLQLEGSKLAVRNGGNAVATIDVASWKVSAG